MTEPAPLSTSDGTKAVLFSYKLYLLPDGNLQSSISNIDPDVIVKVFQEASMEQESIGMNVSAIKFLLDRMTMLDRELGDHLQSLA